MRGSAPEGRVVEGRSVGHAGRSPVAHEAGRASAPESNASPESADAASSRWRPDGEHVAVRRLEATLGSNPAAAKSARMTGVGPAAGGAGSRSPGTRRAESGQRRMVRTMSVLADVAEDPAHQHQVGRHGVGVPAALGRIALDHASPGRPPRRRRPAAGRTPPGRDRARPAAPDVARPGMIGQHVDHVAPLAGAQAHDPDRTGRAPRRGRRPTAACTRPQPHRERRGGILVGLVPAHPVRIAPARGRHGVSVPRRHDGSS